MPAISLVGGAYQSRSLRLDAQRCINLYPERDETGEGKNKGVLIGTPGLSLFATIPGIGGIRALYTASTGRCFAVRGSGVYELTSAGVVTLLGTLLTTTGPVRFADNGLQIMLVDGGYGYTLTLATNVVAQITDPAFTGGDFTAFLDGYFVWNVPGTGRFQISPLYATAPLDALDIATAEGAPDNLLGLIVFRRDLRLFGGSSLESWVNVGAADFPFVRNPSGYIDGGTDAPGSLAQDRDAIYWLGADARGNRQVFRAASYEGERISTHALEYALNQYATVADAQAWCYQEEGHAFYVVTFPTANATWCYDAMTGTWHERLFWNTSTAQWERHRATCYCRAFSRHLVGDYVTGQVYSWGLDTYTDNAMPLRRLRTMPHLSAPDLLRVFYHRFTLDADVGVGLDGAPVVGADPELLLRWSDDGGSTWSMPRTGHLGRLGAYGQRILWERLGSGRDRVFELSSSAPVAQRWVAAHVQLAGGNA